MKPELRTRKSVVEMFQRGLSYGQISQATGLSRGTIGDKLAAWRRSESVVVTRSAELWTPEEDAVVIAGAKARMGMIHVAGKIGRSYRATLSRLSSLRTQGELHGTPGDSKCGDETELRRELEASSAALVRGVAMAIRNGDHNPKMERAA